MTQVSPDGGVGAELGKGCGAKNEVPRMKKTPRELGYEGVMLACIIMAIFFGGYALGSSTEKTTKQDWPIQIGFTIFCTASLFVVIGIIVEGHYEELTRKNEKVIL